MNRLAICALTLMMAACGTDEAVDAMREAEMEVDAVRETEMEAEILEALDQQKAAWNEGDIEGFVSWYVQSDDLRFTTSRGMLKGADEVRNRYEESYANRDRMGRLDFEILEFRGIDATHAVVIGKWTIFRESDRPEGYFTLLWNKTDEGWRIAVDHTS